MIFKAEEKNHYSESLKKILKEGLFFCVKRDYLANCKEDKTEDWVSNPPEIQFLGEVDFSGDLLGIIF